jgi:TATA-binding protein-associated factor Taf7
MEAQHIRHGDVLLTRVDSLPVGKEIPHDGEFVVAHGETGHRHRIQVKEKEDMKVVNVNGVIYMSLTIPAPLMHEEHKTIEIPKGIYRIGNEREFDYALESIRQVAD